MTDSGGRSARQIISGGGPLLLAIVVVGILLIFADFVSSMFCAGVLNTSGLYNAVFGWSAIQTGFLFAAYGFVVTSNEQFIILTKHTLPMQDFIRSTKRATTIGFVLTFFSMVMMLFDFRIQAAGWPYFLVVIWFGVFVWAFLEFMRVFMILGILMQPSRRPTYPG